MDSANRPKLVLVPRPLTLLAAFAYYALVELLEIGYCDSDGISYRWVDTHPRGEFISESGVVVNLNAPATGMNEALLSKLRGSNYLLPYGEVRALRDFAMRGEHNRTWPAWKEVLHCLSYLEDPREALDILCEVFRSIREKRADPREKLPEFPEFLPPPVALSLPEIPDQRLVTLPVIKKNISEKPSSVREPYDFTVKRLSERKVFELMPQQNILTIGGPPGSGKSTLVAALFVEMTNILSSLCSRGGIWNVLEFECELQSLDAGTNTAESILRNWGQDKEFLDSQKQPWTMDLADETVRQVREKSARAQLTLTDLPGKIDAITETLVAPVTFGGIITNDWGSINEWRDFFGRTGVPIVFEVKATSETSLVTSYWQGESISGRVNRLARIAAGWDSFIRTIAEFLLFDILPGRIETSRKRLEQFGNK